MTDQNENPRVYDSAEQEPSTDQPIYTEAMPLPPEEPPQSSFDPSTLRFSSSLDLHKTQWRLCKPRFPWLAFAILLGSFLLLPIFSALTDSDVAFPAGLILGLLILVFSANGIAKKAYMKQFDPEKPVILEFAAEGDRLKVSVRRAYGDCALLSETYISPEDVTSVKRGDGLCTFVARGVIYSIPLMLLDAHPEIEALLPSPVRKNGDTAYRPTSLKTKLAVNLSSWLTFAFTLFSLFGFIILTFIISAVTGLPMDFSLMIAALLCIWIPLSCIALGIVFRVKFRKGLNNIIMGAVILFFLAAYLLAGVAASVTLSLANPEEKIAVLEEQMGIDLPSGTQRSYSGTSNSDYFYTAVELSEEDCAYMDELVKSEPWIDELSTVQERVYGLSEGVDDEHYFLIWNSNTGVFTDLPEEDGHYRYVLITYDAVTGILSYNIKSLDFAV